MMSKINDGGPAFPCEWDTQLGMSLRDYFAGQALMGFMANTNRPLMYSQDDADWAYTIADAMIKARGEKP